MKRIVVAIGFLMILVFGVTYVYADNPAQKGMGEMGHSHKSWGPDKKFSFTPEQKAKFQELQRNFRRDNAQLIGSLVAKKIELQALWTDPKADANAIMGKAKELRDIQDQLRDKFVQTMLEARKLLTPEQIANWKPGWMWGCSHRHGRHMMGYGEMMMGHGAMMGHEGMMEHRGMMGHGHGRCGG